MGKWSLLRKWSYPADSEVLPLAKWANLTSLRAPASNFTVYHITSLLRQQKLHWQKKEQTYKIFSCVFALFVFHEWIDAICPANEASWIGFAMISRFAPWIELQPMCRKAQFMSQAIHERAAFNSRAPRGCNSLRVILNGEHAFNCPAFIFLRKTKVLHKFYQRVKGLKSAFWGFYIWFRYLFVIYLTTHVRYTRAKSALL